MRKKLDDNGFSLIEALLGLVILAASGVLIASLSKSSFQFMNGMEKTQTITTILEDVKMVMKSNVNCTLNLKGTPISMGDSSGAPLTGIRLFGKNKELLNTVAQVGDSDKGLTLTDMRLVPLAKVDDNLIVTHLKLEFTKMNGTLSQKVIRQLPIYARTQSGKITECWQRYDQGVIEASQICKTISDGSLNSVIDDQCTIENSKWFEGTQVSSTCPAGTYLNAGANALSNCRCVQQSGFIDNFEVSAKKLTDGSVASFTRKAAIAEIDTKSNTCQCIPAVDLDANQKSRIKTSILCIIP